jgi:hypothetical protein
MRTNSFLYIFIAAAVLTLTSFVSRSYAAEATIVVSPPPTITVPANPDVIMVPDTDVYYIPMFRVILFFITATGIVSMRATGSHRAHSTVLGCMRKGLPKL